MTTEAFREGRRAAKEGKKSYDNPYTKSDLLTDEQIHDSEDWYDGYESFKTKETPSNTRIRNRKGID